MREGTSELSWKGVTWPGGRMFLGSISKASVRRDGKGEMLKSAQRISPIGRLQLMMMSRVWRAGMVGSASSVYASK
jgi:hypothetical protein